MCEFREIEDYPQEYCEYCKYHNYDPEVGINRCEKGE